jgi:hypothetical protein
LFDYCEELILFCATKLSVYESFVQLNYARSKFLCKMLSFIAEMKTRTIYIIRILLLFLFTFAFEKLITGIDQSKVAGFEYYLEGVGVSWHLEQVLPTEDTKTIKLDFK